MAEKFYTILTNIGKAQIANSGVMGSKVNFVKFKIGDGNGAYYEPTENQKDLVHTVYEGNITDIETDKTNPNWMRINLMIPANVGGFMIREYGVFDSDGNMLAVAKCAESYKPVAEDGSTKELILRMILAVSNTKSINMELDPTLVFVTKEELEQLRKDLTEQLKDIANKQTKLENTVANIDLNATKVNLNPISGMNSRNVQAGMQELFTFASNGKSSVAGKVGNVSGNNTFTQIGDEVQNCKNIASNALNSKNVSASGNEALASLASKIANISIQGMGGKEFIQGTVRGENRKTFRFEMLTWNFTNGGFKVFNYASVQLGFNPSLFVAYGKGKDGDEVELAICLTIINNICFYTTSSGVNLYENYGEICRAEYENGILKFPCLALRNLNYIAIK